MGIFLGIDVGAVSVKIALLSDNESLKTIQHAATFQNLFYQPQQNGKLKEEIFSKILITNYCRLKGSPVSATQQLLKQIFEIIPQDEVLGARVCGSGGPLIQDHLGFNHENEFRAIARGVGELYPNISTVFEMGGQNAKYISLERDPESGTAGIADYEKSGDCAAGTGSFLDQQANRLKYNITDIGKIVSEAERGAKVA